MKQIFTLLISFCCLLLTAQTTTTVDTFNKKFIIYINKDEAQTRMTISIKNIVNNKIDTIYDNLSTKSGVPTKLEFAKIISDKYFVMMVETPMAFLYDSYEWDDGWKPIGFTPIAWKNTTYSTAIDVIDYITIRVVSGKNAFLWKFDVEKKSMNREEIKSDKN